jgi:hypothetical protein
LHVVVLEFDNDRQDRAGAQQHAGRPGGGVRRRASVL